MYTYVIMWINMYTQVFFMNNVKLHSTALVAGQNFCNTF